MVAPLVKTGSREAFASVRAGSRRTGLEPAPTGVESREKHGSTFPSGKPPRTRRESVENGDETLREEAVENIPAPPPPEEAPSDT